jgi:hypothetical protein
VCVCVGVCVCGCVCVCGVGVGVWMYVYIYGCIGERTLRSYSKPMDLEKEFGAEWWKERGHEGSRKIAYRLDELPHLRLFRDSSLKKGLRGADVFMYDKLNH